MCSGAVTGAHPSADAAPSQRTSLQSRWRVFASRYYRRGCQSTAVAIWLQYEFDTHPRRCTGDPAGIETPCAQQSPFAARRTPRHSRSCGRNGPVRRAPLTPQPGDRQDRTGRPLEPGGHIWPFRSVRFCSSTRTLSTTLTDCFNVSFFPSSIFVSDGSDHLSEFWPRSGPTLRILVESLLSCSRSSISGSPAESTNCRTDPVTSIGTHPQASWLPAMPWTRAQTRGPETIHDLRHSCASHTNLNSKNRLLTCWFITNISLVSDSYHRPGFSP